MLVLYTHPRHLKGYVDSCLVKARELGDPVVRSMNPLTPITLSCDTIHFPAVYNMQSHQKPVPIIPCLNGVGGYRFLESVKSIGLGVLLHISYIISLPKYKGNNVAMNNTQTNKFAIRMTIVADMS